MPSSVPRRKRASNVAYDYTLMASLEVREVAFRIDTFRGLDERSLALRPASLQKLTKQLLSRRLRRVRFLTRRSDSYWARDSYPGGTYTRKFLTDSHDAGT